MARTLLLSNVAALLVHATADSPATRHYTIRSTTTEEVPTFYHLAEYKNVACNGTAYTFNLEVNCNGWHGLSEHECKMKCAGGETPTDCQQGLCFALVYFHTQRWCHLFDHANCLGTLDVPNISTWKKEHYTSVTAPAHMNIGALALAAGTAIAAAAEWSHRAHNGTHNGSHDPGTQATNASRAVWHHPGHAKMPRGSIHSNPVHRTPPPSVEEILHVSTTSWALPEMITSTPLPSVEQILHLTTTQAASGKQLQSGAQRTESSSSSGSGSFGFNFLAVLGILLGLCICMACWQALTKKKSPRGRSNLSSQEPYNDVDGDPQLDDDLE